MSSSTALVGRAAELGILESALDLAEEGEGSAILISGEPGLGKTRLMEELALVAQSRGFGSLSGAARAEVPQPFQIFSKALENEVARPIFEEQVYLSFSKLFAINRSGLLLAQTSSEEDELDPDIFAGMLSAVQDFVRDSLDDAGKAGLGRLEYGDMKILIEHGSHIFITAVVKGSENVEMKVCLKRALKCLEDEHGPTLEKWSGRVEDVRPVEEALEELAGRKFLVKKDLEGVKLENERIRIADDVFRLMAEISERSPLLITLEDIHWADESSLFVLNYLARNIVDRRIVLVGTYRPGESDALEETVAKMLKEGIVRTEPLGRLALGDVTGVVNDMFPGIELPGRFLEDLARRTQGNPFFMREMLWQMREEGNIAEVDGSHTLVSGELTIPGSVEGLVQQRLARLDPGSMALAEYAACIGGECDRGTLFSVPGIRDPQGALAFLLDSGMMATLDDRVEFSHAIYREVIYSGLSERWRTTYHRHLGHYIEGENSHRLDEVVYELARHYSAGRVHPKAYEYGMMAVEKAEAVFAPEQALAYCRMALTSLEEMKRAGLPEGISLDNKMAMLHLILGDWEETEKAYRHAIEKAGAIGESGLEADAMMGLGDLFRLRGDVDRAMEILTEGKKIYDQLDDLAGRETVARNIGTCHYTRGDYGEAMKWYVLRRDLAEELGDMKKLASAVGNIGTIHYHLGELDKAMEFYREHNRIAIELGDKYMQAITAGNIGIIHYAKGEYDMAERFLKDYLKVSEEIQDMRSKAIAVGNLGLIYEETGQFERALEHHNTKLELSRAMGDRTSESVALGNIAAAYYHHGDFDLAERNYDRAIDIGEAIGLKYYTAGYYSEMAGMLFSLGRYGEALAMNDKNRKLSEELNRPDTLLSSRVLAAKLTGLEDRAGGAKDLERILEEVVDEPDVALLNYELFKLTGSEENRDAAISLFEKLYRKSPNTLYKKRADELKGYTS